MTATRRHSRFAIRLALLLMALAVMPAAAFAAAHFEARKSNAAGVQVVVTPKPIAGKSGTWDFEVKMDTHTKPLSDDLVRASELVLDGRAIAPVAWTGDGPGGHHRKGVLQFPRPAAMPKAMELRIKGIGGAELRTFRWDQK